MSLRIQEYLPLEAYPAIRRTQRQLHIQLDGYIDDVQAGTTLDALKIIYASLGNAISAIDAIVASIPDAGGLTGTQRLVAYAESDGGHGPGYNAASEYQSWKTQINLIRSWMINNITPQSNVDGASIFISAAELAPLATGLQDLKSLGQG